MSLEKFIDPNQIIFEKSLKNISGKKFTSRQIDVIACIYHMRGTGQIATFLDITKNTVEAHIINIYGKFSQDKSPINNRDQLISFVEHSGIGKVIRQYYINLRINSEFSSCLNKIKTLTPKGKYLFEIITTDKDESTSIIKDKLTSDLQTIRFNARDQIKDEKLDDLDSKVMRILINSPPPGNQDANCLDFVIATSDKFLDSEVAKGCRIYDFSDYEKYFRSFMNVIKEFFSNSKIDEIISEASQKIDNIRSMEEGTKHAVSIRPQYLSRINVLTICFLFVVLVIAFFQYLSEDSGPALNDQVSTKFSLTELSQQVDYLVDNFSTDYISSNELFYQNNNLATKTVNIIQEFENNPELLDQYFKLSKQNIIKYLFIILTTSHYYTYNMHDGETACTLLTKAINVTNQHLISTSRVKYDIDNLSYGELFAELNTFPELAQIYARALYALGRSFIFIGEAEKGLKYFERSYYLGKKLNLFEGFLSLRSGIGYINCFKIEKLIKDQQYSRARKIAQETSDIYKNLLNDKRVYINNYRPFHEHQEKIDIAKDEYNRLTIIERILVTYKYLICLEKDPKKKLALLNELTPFLVNKAKDGLLDQLSKFPQKRVSIVYTFLGELLLDLYKSNVRFNKALLSAISKDINLTNTATELDIVISIFEFAKDQAKKSSFIKTATYRKLADTLELKLETGNLDNYSANIISTNIKHLNEEADKIDAELNQSK